ASVIGAAAAIGMLLVGSERPSYSPDRDEVTSRRSRRSVAGIAGAVVAVATLELIGLLMRWGSG
ncbi:hypothetical protein J8J40_32805, partial [Mycobacterium tuberculosis]|nr:hypothetical protein [Mycobacterium tuberculosis]